MPVDQAAFREAISHFASGVTVITTLHDGNRVGMTASAVTSLSLDPILLLVCINTKLATHTAIETSRRFVVNVLGEEHAELALHFARPSDDKFAGIATSPDYELPVLEDAIAHFICDVHERIPGGDHSIFIGQVLECAAQPGKRPLVYYRSGFGALHDKEAELQRELAVWDAVAYGEIPPD